MLQTEEVLASGVCDWNLGNILQREVDAEIVETLLGHQSVCAKRFLIEEDGFFQVQ